MNTEPVLLPHSLKRWERTTEHLANEIHLLFNSWKEIIRKWDQNRHNEHTARNILWFAFLLVRWIIARYFRNEFRDRSLASVSFNQAECFKLWIVKVQKLKYSRALLLSVAFQIYTGEISQRLTVLWVCVCVKCTLKPWHQEPPGGKTMSGRAHFMTWKDAHHLKTLNEIKTNYIKSCSVNPSQLKEKNQFKIAPAIREMVAHLLVGTKTAREKDYSSHSAKRWQANKNDSFS